MSDACIAEEACAGVDMGVPRGTVLNIRWRSSPLLDMTKNGANTSLDGENSY